MAEGLTLGPAEMAKASALTREAKADLNKRLDTLRNNIQQDLQANWKGAGATAFQQVLTAWDQRTAKLVAVLDEFDQSFQDTSKSFAEADAEHVAMLNKFQSSLG
jgi:WXG100 family type VII secretion target